MTTEIETPGVSLSRIRSELPGPLAVCVSEPGSPTRERSHVNQGGGPPAVLTRTPVENLRPRPACSRAAMVRAADEVLASIANVQLSEGRIQVLKARIAEAVEREKPLDSLKQMGAAVIVEAERRLDAAKIPLFKAEQALDKELGRVRVLDEYGKGAYVNGRRTPKIIELEGIHAAALAEVEGANSILERARIEVRNMTEQIQFALDQVRKHLHELRVELNALTAGARLADTVSRWRQNAIDAMNSG